MKRVVITLIVLALLAFVAWKFIFKSEKKSEKQEEKQQPLAIKENSGPFNQSYSELLNAYFGLKDALVASDTAKASAAAKTLIAASDSLKLNEIKGDTLGVIKETAGSYTSTIKSSATALSGEKDIKGKRKEFEMIADAMWNMTRTVRYDGQKLYWQFCPMAFNNKGAYWMSNEAEIKNPYFGNEMLNCGSVEDSLDYSKK